MLEIRDLSKSFRGSLPEVRAVDRVSLSIPDGEFFSLLGPSGCGKTTLLRTLAGFEDPTEGEIRLGGARIDVLPANRRSMNLVFQRYALFPHLNVRQNVEFGLKMKRTPSAEIRSRVEEMLALVRMRGFEERAIATLSGGQQQRVALARSLVNRPRVLLLDEPLSALDLQLRQQMQIELRAIQKRVGNTFVLVTHDQEEALTLSDRIAVMNHGKIEQVGEPRAIYEKPETAFVASFIGSINAWRLDSCPASVKAALDPILPKTPSGAALSVFVRPEKISIRPAGSAPTGREEILVGGMIRDASYQGAFTRFVIESASLPGAPILVHQSSASRAGESVTLAWSIADCRILPT